MHQIVGQSFRRGRTIAEKTIICFVMSVSLPVLPSVHMEQLGSH